MTPKSCWILTEGYVGLEAQCRGLAEALGVDPVYKRVRFRFPWTVLPNRLWFRAFSALAPGSDQLAPPWPDLVISCGNGGVPLALAIKRASGARTVHIQHPSVDPRHFDAVIVPRHDDLAGENVIVSKAAIHGVTPAKLADGAREWGPAFAHLPRPLVAVLIGGSNGRYQLTAPIVTRLADRLAALARERGAGIAITPSRRTASEAVEILRQRLAGLPAYIWDGAGANPYFGLLGLADAIVVTEDSVSMTSEACATGKPVYVVELEGSSRRLDRFQADLRDDGMTRPFTGALESWTYVPPDDTAHAAAELKRRFGWP
ncbi:MAG: mitochondrial fission ELM1 family protein [Rhodospirillales bacterium]|nr:mitochondrial fission ELM1 family protein [Rhodospirillales bacterium]